MPPYTDRFSELLKCYYTLDGPPHLQIGSPLFKTWLAWLGAVRHNPENTSVLRVDSSCDDIQTPTQTPTSSPVVSLSSSEEAENIPRTSSGLDHSAAAYFATRMDSVHDIDENPQSPLALPQTWPPTSSPRALVEREPSQPSTSKCPGPTKCWKSSSGSTKRKGKLPIARKRKATGKRSLSRDFHPKGFAPGTNKKAQESKAKTVNPNAKSAFIWHLEFFRGQRFCLSE